MKLMKYGYARVSTDDQNPALQLAALKKAGCQAAFKDEGLSGATTKRPAFSAASGSWNTAARSSFGGLTGGP
jgi:DNA invertase Pin-like site-specific DNA recombinase